MKFFAIFIFFITANGHAEVVNFGRGLELAMQKSEVVKEQQAQNEISAWQKTAALYNVLPKLTATASQTQSSSPSIFTPGAPQFSKETQDGLSATFNLFRGGADLHGIKAAQDQVRATLANTDNTILQTEEAAAADLLSTVYEKQHLAILQASLEYDNHFLEIAEKKYQNGAEALEQLDKIRIDRSNTEALVRDAELTTATALAKQQVWIEKNEVNTEWPWIKSLREEKASGAYRKRITKETANMATAKRPDVISSRYTMQSQNEQLYAARGALMPSLDLTLSYGYDDLGPGWDDSWSSSVMLTWTIFNGLKDYSTYRIANENYFISQYAFELLQRQAAADIEVSETNFVKSVQTAVDRENVLDSSLRLLKTTERRFQTGHATPDELSLDQHRVIEARALVARGWFDAHTALIHFAHSRGLRVKDLF